MKTTIAKNIEYLKTRSDADILSFMDQNWDDVFTYGLDGAIYSREFIRRVLVPAIARVMAENKLDEIPASDSDYKWIQDTIDCDPHKWLKD